LQDIANRQTLSKP